MRLANGSRLPRLRRWPVAPRASGTSACNRTRSSVTCYFLSRFTLLRTVFW